MLIDNEESCDQNNLIHKLNYLQIKINVDKLKLSLLNAKLKSYWILKNKNAFQ